MKKEIGKKGGFIDPRKCRRKSSTNDEKKKLTKNGGIFHRKKELEIKIDKHDGIFESNGGIFSRKKELEKNIDKMSMSGSYPYVLASFYALCLIHVASYSRLSLFRIFCLSELKDDSLHYKINSNFEQHLIAIRDFTRTQIFPSFLVTLIPLC